MKEKTFSQVQIFRAAAVITLMVLAAMATGALFAAYPVKVVAAAAFIVLVILYPEAVFALFLTAALYKGPPILELPYVDLTVFLWIFTVVGILWGIIHRRIKLTAPPFRMYFPFLVISCLAALSLTYTIAPVYGLAKLSRFVTLTALAFFAPLYLFQERKRFRNFVVTYIAGAMAMLYYLYHQGWLSPDVVDVVDKSLAANSALTTAAVYNYLAMGSAMAVVFIMTLVYLFPSDNSLIRRAFYIAVLAPAAVYCLMITGARGPIISLALTLASVLVLSRHPHKESSRLRLWILAALIAGGLYVGYEYQNYARMTERMTQLGEGGGGSALERIYMAKASLQAMSSMPYFLTGLGIGGFSVYYRGFDSTLGEYPHNILLELGTETGIAGLAAVILLIVWSFGKAAAVARKLTGKDYYIAACAGSVTFFTFLNALKSGDLNDNRLFFAMIGLIFCLDRETKNETSALRRPK